MILAISPNPAWDVTYYIDRLVPGQPHRVKQWTGRAGGKGLNVARVAATMGYPVHAVVPVGGVLKDVFAKELADSGLSATLVDVGAELRHVVAVLPDQPSPADQGEATLFNEAGPTFSAQQWGQVIDAVADYAPRAEVATINGSLPPGVGKDELLDLLDVLRKADCKVMADLWSTGLLWAARAEVALLKPNRGELLAVTGADSEEAGAHTLIAEGAGAVLVTDGPGGMTLYRSGSDEVLHAARRSPVYGNSSGAGDAALAVIAATEDQPWPERLRLACAVAAASVMRPVSGEVNPRDVKDLAPDVEVKAT